MRVLFELDNDSSLLIVTLLVNQTDIDWLRLMILRIIHRLQIDHYRDLAFYLHVRP